MCAHLDHPPIRIRYQPPCWLVWPGLGWLATCLSFRRSVGLEPSLTTRDVLITRDHLSDARGLACDMTL